MTFGGNIQNTLECGLLQFFMQVRLISRYHLETKIRLKQKNIAKTKCWNWKL